MRTAFGGIDSTIAAMRRGVRKLIVTLLFCSVAFSLSAQFSGTGSGTADDPYRIYNMDQLNQVRNFHDGEYFSLETDLDMADWIAENNPVEGWQPMNARVNFDGNGYTISNMWINRPNTNNVGLFGYITSENSSITNLHLINVKINGRNHVGGIAGIIRSGFMIENCSVQGTIIGNEGMGGIISEAITYNKGSETAIEKCYFQGVIMGKNTIGGILGHVYGYSDYYTNINISNCGTDCIIKASGENIGGIVALTDMDTDDVFTINECYSLCTIEGGYRIGGIIGNPSTFVKSNECYSHIVVSEGNSVGGIIFGDNYTSYPVNDCYATGIIQGTTSNVGGITAGSHPVTHSYAQFHTMSGGTVVGLGLNASNSVAINNRLVGTLAVSRVGNGSNNLAWNLATMMLNGKKQPIPNDSPENGTNTGLSTLKLQATYEGIGWDFANTWKINETESFPYFQWQTAPPYFVQTLKKGDTRLAGQCTEAGIVTVRIGDRRYEVQSNGNNWSLDLDEPLEAADVVEMWVQAEGKAPSYVVCTSPILLTGSGTETDPYLIETADDLQAISDLADEECYYKLTADIDLTNYIATNGWAPVVLSGSFDGQGHAISGLQCNTANLAGLFYTLASGCEIKDLKVIVAEDAKVQGSAETGGIVARNYGTITNCSVEGNVQGVEQVGGIAGINEGMITGCKKSGTVSGGSATGGIAGQNKGTVEQCYTDGFVETSTAGAKVGGIVGWNTEGKVNDCYSSAEIAASGSNAYGAGIVGYNESTVEYCYSDGSVSGYSVAGICGYNSGTNAYLRGCVAANSTLSGETRALRILGGFASGASSPSVTDNYAVKSMVVSVNNVPQIIYDDSVNGTAKTSSELMQKAAYVALGWNFTNAWKIDEGFSYPYLSAFDIPVSEITLDKVEAELTRGEILQLAVTVMPEDARNQRVKWTSSAEKIATVDVNGKVVAIGVGEATITATATDDSGMLATCKVTVTPILTESISLNKKELTIEKTDSVQLVATVLPETADDRTVTWTSSDEEIVVVSADGWVKALKAGTATVTATANDSSKKMATCAVKVTPKLAEEISLNKTELALERTEIAQLTAIVSPETVDDRTVTWHSADEKVATVNSEGLVTAVGVGKTTITATTNDGTKLSASCTFTVSPKLAESVSLNENKLVLKRTRTYQLQATVLPEVADDRGVTWSSDNPMVAKVDDNGLVTALSVGEANITATAADGSGNSATCNVSVAPNLVESLSLNDTIMSLVQGTSWRLKAIVEPRDADDISVTWSSNNADVATVDATGRVSAIGIGEAVITATTNDGSGLSATCYIVVTPKGVRYLNLNTYEMTMKVNESALLEVEVVPDDAEYSHIVWTSSDERVAVVDDNGLVTARGVGQAEITVTAYNFDGSGTGAHCDVTVVPTMVESIALNMSDLELKLDDTYQLEATVSPSDATNKSVAWTSSDESVATVDNNGLVTAVGFGDVYITAAANDGSGVAANCHVTVEPIMATSIKLNEETLLMKKGETSHLEVTVLPHNATDKSVTWTSSDEYVVAVDDGGNIVAVGDGEAEVVATTNDGSNLSASCQVTVIDPEGGVYGVSADGISVFVKDDRIYVTGKEDDDVVTVHTLEGRLVYRGTDNAVNVYSNIYYLVTVRTETYKVFVP